MENKKSVILKVVIAVIVLVAIIAISVILLMNNNKSVNLDLASLNEEMSKMGEFSEMAAMDVDKDTLLQVCGITDTDAVEEVIGKMPLMNVKASMYIVVKATDGKVDYVKEKMEEYAKNYDELWSRYLPDQYELVKARKLEKVGNYVYLIISEEAEELEKAIK